MRRESVMWIMMVLGVACLLQGCASDSLDTKRLRRYRPDASGRNPAAWEDALPADDEPAADPKPARSQEGIAARTLKRGGKVSIYLRGIPQPEEVIEVIDDLGAVSLPLIGSVTLEGLTTGEAEKKIAQAYMDSGYYKSITINVVAEEEEYFVRGEVKKEGAYAIAGDLSLLRAIAAARGYTDYAKTSAIKIIREGSEPLVFDAKAIEEGREPDPLIEPGDIIIVPRRWFW